MSTSITLLVTGLVVIVVSVGSPPAAHAAQPPVGLGTATSFAVLAGTTVTNTGPSTITGDLGVSPGTAVTGFPPGLVSGEIHQADAVALKAQNDLITAYDDAAGRSPVVDKTNDDLGGETLVAGVYRANTIMALTGTVTLDAQGDDSAVWIFQAGSELLAAGSSRVALQGGAQACNVFWQVGSSATIRTSSAFVGTVMALTSITVETGATIQGRALARNGQVSLDTNTITKPNCAAPSPTTDDTTATGGGNTGGNTGDNTGANPTTAAGDSTGGNPTTAAGGTTGGTGRSDNPGTPTYLGPPNPPVVPDGRPPTGQVPMAPSPTDGALWLGAGMAILGAAFGAAAVRRPKLIRLK